MKKNKLLPLFSCLVVLLVISADSYAQCAMCSKVAESDMTKGHPAAVSKNINVAILYLMAIPYLALIIYFRKQLISLYKSFRTRRKASTL